jgi:nitrogen fixation/metabolism regulation signal transduction histidine kinase
MGEAARPAAATGRHQRRLRNYLLDTHFQLKYTSYLVLIAVLLSLSLGVVLWRTSERVIAQSYQTVTQGEQVVSRGRQVLSESKKVSAVVQMNIVKDPVYADNPELLKAFEEDAKAQDDRLVKQQEALEGQSQALKSQSAELTRRQRTTFWAIVGVLVVLVVGIGLAGIVVTHKVAGPIYKMKRQIRDVGDGKLTIPSKLRPGDELVDFFETFNDMVKSLRERQEVEIAKLDSAIEKLEGKADKSELEPLYQLRREMKAALD